MYKYCMLYKKMSKDNVVGFVHKKVTSNKKKVVFGIKIGINYICFKI